MWIDTHNHFNFDIYNETGRADWTRAQQLGVSAQFVMSVAPKDFSTLPKFAEQFDGTYFALGIHPLYIDALDLATSVEQLKRAVALHINNPKFIGIGEIGLDGFIKESDFQRQTDFFTAQLKIAREFELPVFMHVRKSQDLILKYCRQVGVGLGIAHAFNGSHQQAERFLTYGFKLGFGGAFTYPRAKQLRRLLCDLPIEAFVLEADAPDMSPEWLYGQTNYSDQLPKMAERFGELRGIEIKMLSKAIWQNTEKAILRLF